MSVNVALDKAGYFSFDEIFININVKVPRVDSMVIVVQVGCCKRYTSFHL